MRVPKSSINKLEINERMCKGKKRGDASCVKYTTKYSEEERTETVTIDHVRQENNLKELNSFAEKKIVQKFVTPSSNNNSMILYND